MKVKGKTEEAAKRLLKGLNVTDLTLLEKISILIPNLIYGGYATCRTRLMTSSYIPHTHGLMFCTLEL